MFRIIKFIKIFRKYILLLNQFYRLKKKGYGLIGICIYSPSDLHHLSGIIEIINNKNDFKVVVFYFFEFDKHKIVENDIIVIQKYFVSLIPYLPINLFINTESGISFRRSHKQKIIHLLHSTASVHIVYPEGAFENYDFICCAGPYHVKEFKQMLKNKHKKYYLLTSGYPVIDNLYYQKQLQKNPNPKATILYAPSWGKDNSLTLFGYEIISTLIKDYSVILRPHPMNLIEDKITLNKILTTFSINKSFRIDTSFSPTSSLLSADLLISDFSGISLEFAFGCEKPVLSIDSKPKILNPNWNKYAPTQGVQIDLRNSIGEILSPSQIPDIKYVIDSLLSNETKVNEIIKQRESYLYNFQTSLDMIYSSLLEINKNDFSKFIEVQ